MATNRWRLISASLMLTFFVQALLLASLHFHLPIQDTVAYDHSPNGDLVDYAAHQECPVCQFLSTVQLDAAQVSAQIHATHVTELFVSVPASPVIGQSGCISLRAPPFVIC